MQLTATDLVQLITALAALVGAVGSILNHWKIVDASQKIEDVHKATNGLTEKLLETTRESAMQTGATQERERKENAGSVLPPNK